MAKIKGAYNCSYCHGDINNACTACDYECNCIELDNHRRGECDIDCSFCEETTQIKARLEYLRSQLDKECISYSELAELESLKDHIEPDDVQLLEATGVPEIKA